MNWRISNRVVLLLMLSAFVLPISVDVAQSPALAYSVGGWWVRGPLNITTCNHSASLSYAAWNYAENAWNQSAAKVLFVVNCQNNLLDLFQENSGPTGVLGTMVVNVYSTPNCNNWKQVASAAGQLNTYYTDNPNWTAAHRQEEAAHELGHVPGLDDNRTLKTLMYYNDNNYKLYGIDTPQGDDINGVNYITGLCS